MFFNKEETDKVFRGDHEIVQKQYSCADCKLKLQCSTPKVPVIGEGAKRILIVAGAVHKSWEDSQGENKGPDYSFIKRQLKRVGIDMDKDCWFVHAVRCYTHDDPTPKTMSACHSVLVKDVAKLNPAVVVPLDKVALDVLLDDRKGGRADSASFYDYCSEVIPDQKLRAWIIPLYERGWYQKAAEKRTNKFEPIYTNILNNIACYHTIAVPDYQYEKMIQTTTDKKTALQWIDIISTWDKWAWDYETTGIKSQRKEQKIRTVAFSNGKVAYAFPIAGLEEDVADLLANKATKICHNSVFEVTWSRNKLGVKPKNVEDTILLCHVAQNQKPKGLKFWTYVKFGHIGYDQELSEYMKATSEDKKKYGANAINSVMSAPIRPLLKYNALDTVFTYWLFDILKDQLEPQQWNAYKFYMEGQDVFNDLHYHGARINTALIPKNKEIVQQNIDKYSDLIQHNKIILRKWDWSGVFNPGSDVMVRHLVYDILGMEVLEETDSGLASVDDEAIGQMVYEHEWLKDIQQYRRWKKAMAFLEGIEREVVDGKVHSFINLYRVRTYRSSSSDPNLQNVPHHDDEVMNLIRSLYIPDEGHYLAECDYKQLEVRGSASVSGDKALINYCTDPTSDMHRNFASKLFIMEPKLITKQTRQMVKSQLFAEFYGSFYKLIAKAMWKQINAPNAVDVLKFDAIAHLKSHGIIIYDDWESHVKKCEEWLWGTEFQQYQKYRRETYMQFAETGYTDYVTGFRYYGPASSTQLGNAPIQGPSFHANLWAIIQLHRKFKERKMDSRLMLQVHDSIVLSVNPMEEGLVDSAIYQYFTKEVREHFDWILVPLPTEKSAGGVNESWAMKTELGEIHEGGRIIK